MTKTLSCILRSYWSDEDIKYDEDDNGRTYAYTANKTSGSSFFKTPVKLEDLKSLGPNYIDSFDDGDSDGEGRTSSVGLAYIVIEDSATPEISTILYSRADEIDIGLTETSHLRDRLRAEYREKCLEKIMAFVNTPESVFKGSVEDDDEPPESVA